jgi:hypothetical protein
MANYSNSPKSGYRSSIPLPSSPLKWEKGEKGNLNSIIRSVVFMVENWY